MALPCLPCNCFARALAWKNLLTRFVVVAEYYSSTVLCRFFCRFSVCCPYAHLTMATSDELRDVRLVQKFNLEVSAHSRVKRLRNRRWRFSGILDFPNMHSIRETSVFKRLFVNVWAEYKALAPTFLVPRPSVPFRSGCGVEGPWVYRPDVIHLHVLRRQFV